MYNFCLIYIFYNIISMSYIISQQLNNTQKQQHAEQQPAETTTRGTTTRGIRPNYVKMKEKGTNNLVLVSVVLKNEV